MDLATTFITPPTWFILTIAGVAVVLAFLLAWFGHGPPPPNVYHCGRCNTDFYALSERSYPKRCPHCGADDWYH